MRSRLALVALLPLGFAPHGGWHAGQGPVHACVGVSAARCVQRESWASTIRWRGCSECLPHETIAALPPDGIALQVGFSIEHPPVGERTASWPPAIRPRDVGGGFEGVSSRYGVFQLAARFSAVDGYVWAFFGRAHPTPAQLARANAELRTIAAPASLP
jgi:hypothetical protein